MADDTATIDLTQSELRQVTGYTVACAQPARAFEPAAGDDPAVAAGYVARARDLADPVVVDVLRRYPPAPTGGERVGELIHQLDALLRA